MEAGVSAWVWEGTRALPEFLLTSGGHFYKVPFSYNEQNLEKLKTLWLVACAL